MENPSSFDPNQTQWYATKPVADLPPVDPEERRKKWLKIGVIFGGGILVLVLTVFFIRSAFEAQIPKEDVRVQEQTQAVAKCDATKNPEKCKSAVPSDLAAQSGDRGYCQDLGGEERDQCLNAAALSAQESDVCHAIADADRKVACRDAVAASLVRANGISEDACAQYATDTLRETCTQNFLIAQARKGECTDTRITESMCKEGKYTQQALDARDPSLCDQIDTNDGEATCRERVGPGDVDRDGLPADEEQRMGSDDRLVDTDGDALTDYEEVKTYGTNPAKIDTDGDGYADGVEVANGYDPIH